MNNKHVRILIERLNAWCARALEGAATFAATRGHFEVSIEHVVIKLLEEGDGDVNRVLAHYDIDVDELWQGLLEQLADQRAGHRGKPAFSPLLFQWLERGWVVSSLHYDSYRVRSLALIDALVEMSPMLPGTALGILDKLPVDDLRNHYARIVDGSAETAQNAGATPDSASTSPAGTPDSPRPGAGHPDGGDSALARFTEDLTAKAGAGRIDPVLGRDDEIRLMVDILSRRRKNNPILAGDPGVGKTALVEGLALRIAADSVPEALRGIRLHTLDLGLLQAGAGIKGEFEKRLKQVIDEVRNSPRPVVLFIDEAHTLIGAGGEAGMSDAANLLKPALARGELRTIAATTWSEYKRYFERDAALERRFQMVKVEEPSEEKAMLMLTGLKSRLQEHHETLITDDAIDAAVRLSGRYINGRYLPDKAIDLLDTAAARIRMAQAARPASIEAAEAHIGYIEQRLSQLEMEQQVGLDTNVRTVRTLHEDLEAVRSRHSVELSQWQEETRLVSDIRAHSEKFRAQNRQDQPDAAGAIAELQSASGKARRQLARVQGQRAMVQAEVNAAAVADVVSDWTGIPVGKMLKDDAAALMRFEERVGMHVAGQDGALAAIGRAVRSARAGLGNADSPLGVFLLAGPSGVGKTETARAVAEELFGGERFLITINMSEYQEAHTVSQLKGSPPGYVGYGEGGVLTEAVRQRPYSVVLLDEVEKAHPDVLNMFYQVFDRGVMRDGEGRETDFRNTIIVMTSNLGSETLTELTTPPTDEASRCTDQVGDGCGPAAWRSPRLAEMRTAIEPELLRHFPPALLGRMQVVPYGVLGHEALTSIAALKLDAVARSLKHTHDIEFRCEPPVLDSLARRSAQMLTGARHINAIIEQQLLPEMARNILNYMIEEDMPDVATLEMNDSGELACVFADRMQSGKPDGMETSKELPARCESGVAG